MITILLLTLFFAGELFFLIWNHKVKLPHTKEKLLYRIILAAILVLLLLTGPLQGMGRYAGILILLLLQVLITGSRLLYQRKKASPSSSNTSIRLPRQIGRIIGVMLLYALALVPAMLFPQYRQPRVTGSHDVAIQEYTWTDENRIETFTDSGEHRAVTVKFWYPQEEGNYPLVVFSHGAFGIIDSNYSTCNELASNGYVVASIAHPYHAFYVEDVNGKVTLFDMDFFQQVMTDNGSDDPEQERGAYERSREWLKVRTDDENFVLDTILAKAKSGEDGPFSRINSDKIGLFGHSLGGASSVMLGRQRDDIDAVIDLEGTMLGEYVGYEDNDYVFLDEPYPLPLLDVNSRAVYEEAGSYQDRTYVNFYVGEHAKDFREIIFENAAHMNFTDLPLVSPFLAHMLGCGTTDPRTCIENVNDMVLKFFNYYLKDAPELELPEIYGER